MTHLSTGIFIIVIICLIVFIAIISITITLMSGVTPVAIEFPFGAGDSMPVQTVKKNTQEGFQQREVYKEAETQKLLGQLYANVKTRAYLNDLIKADYIQSYPWFANNPNGATTYNYRLFNQSNDVEQIETQNQNYYDFGEITYIGNPL